MPRTVVSWIVIALAGIGSLPAAKPQQSPNPVPTTAASYRVLLDRYCVTCHNQKLKTADLTLDKADVGNVSDSAPVWEKVVRKLRTGAMPPAGMPRPEKTDSDSFAAYLETALDRAGESRPNPGRPGVHRLNRAEYANAIRDILAVDIAGQSLLPPDDSSEGFDNIGAVLSVSPMLLERYMSAARKISRLAIGDPAIRPVIVTYDLPDLLMQEDRVSEDLPLGSRGGAALRYHFPVDGEYVVKVGLQRALDVDSKSYIKGLTEPHHLDVRLDGARIKLFTVGGEHKGKSGSNSSFGDPAQEEYEQSADAALEVRFSAKAGTRLIQVAFLKESSEFEGVLQQRLTSWEARSDKDKRYYLEGDPAVASVTVHGPFNAKGLGETLSRRKIFVCRPTASKDSAGGSQEEACARKILATLARRAYRRPVTDDDVRPLLSLYNTARSKGDFEAGIRVALQRILVSPEFLFRIERDPASVTPGSPYRIGDIDLASRLSFFLWSSVPDDELLEMAARGKLRDRVVLEQQMRRMLADSRSQALVSNFAEQWLLLRNMAAVSPDPEEFPEFDDNLREAFQQETTLFFESMMREDRSVLDLLNANYTFVNERLAQHYGIPNIHGSRFRRVMLQDENRRGLLGLGSLLTVTSYATRTSVVLRGKWVLDNILGTPVPPPPPNVPSLKDRNEAGKLLSVRQQMEQHRANPVCAGCHTRMDPLGFALEPFDAIGQWRTTEGPNETPIDSSGVLPDGTRIQGPAELRKVLMRNPEQFATTVTEKLLTYALGRGIEYYDAPAVRKIVRDAASGGYRWSSIISGIVKSVPFQMRKSAEPDVTSAQR